MLGREGNRKGASLKTRDDAKAYLEAVGVGRYDIDSPSLSAYRFLASLEAYEFVDGDHQILIDGRWTTVSRDYLRSLLRKDILAEDPGSCVDTRQLGEIIEALKDICIVEPSLDF